MKRSQLEIAERLLNLKFQQKQSQISTLNAHEVRLRAQIAKINEQDKCVEQAATHQMRSIGADVIWKAWVGRTKTTLNQELAQILAQKEFLLKDLRREYGKTLAANELRKNAAAKHQKKKSNGLLLQATDQSLFP